MINRKSFECEFIFITEDLPLPATRGCAGGGVKLLKRSLPPTVSKDEAAAILQQPVKRINELNRKSGNKMGFSILE